MNDLQQLLVDTFTEPGVIVLCAISVVLAGALAYLYALEFISPPPPARRDEPGDMHAQLVTRRVRAGMPPPLKCSYDSRRHPATGARADSPSAPKR